MVLRFVLSEMLTFPFPDCDGTRLLDCGAFGTFTTSEPRSVCLSLGVLGSGLAKI